MQIGSKLLISISKQQVLQFSSVYTFGSHRSLFLSTCFSFFLRLSPSLLLPAVRTDKIPGEWRDAHFARTGSADQFWLPEKTSHMRGQSVAFCVPLCRIVPRLFALQSEQVREDNEHLRHDNFQATAAAAIEDVWTRPRTSFVMALWIAFGRPCQCWYNTGWSD